MRVVLKIFFLTFGFLNFRYSSKRFLQSFITVSLDKKIPAFGIFILGQEQDEVGRNFSLGESFYGSLSQLNVWSTVLPEAEIVEMSRYRCVQVFGNELAWPDFLEKTIEVSKVNEFCTGNERFFFAFCKQIVWSYFIFSTFTHFMSS